MSNHWGAIYSAISRPLLPPGALPGDLAAQRRATPQGHSSLNRTLAALAAAVVILDSIWIMAGRFQIDAKNYALLFVIIPPLVAASRYYYSPKKNEPALGAMLSAVAFLIVFPTGCCLLSYLMLTISGPRIDGILAGLDQAMGFDWPAVMAFASNHLVLTSCLKLAYLSVLPQTVLLLFMLCWKQDSLEIYRLCFTLSMTAVLTIVVWTAFPAFGAFSVFELPASVAGRLGLALDGSYGRSLVTMLKTGPGFISPGELRGIIGFPSYHTVQALVLIWYARKIPYLRWASLALNIAVLIAVPIHGGHHLVDMFGGLAVAAVCIPMSEYLVRVLQRWGLRRQDTEYAAEASASAGAISAL